MRGMDRRRRPSGPVRAALTPAPNRRPILTPGADRANRAAAEVYQTHERMLTLMAEALAVWPEIGSAMLFLRKPVDPDRGGALGLRLTLDAPALAALRAAPPTS